jgi:drug/metabolite transporter (DMT)-like permease
LLRRGAAISGLLLVTAIWGTTFVVVDEAIKSIPTFWFLASRFLLAGLVLLALSPRGSFNRGVVRTGVRAGLWLFAAYATQTLGLLYTTPGRAGFITGFSVILVPIIGALFYRASIRWQAWAAAGIGFAGLVLISGVQGRFNMGDLLVLLCAFGFAMQILSVDQSNKDVKLPALPLTAVQCLTVSALSMLLVPFEPFPAKAAPLAWAAVVYTATAATSFAYGLQLYCQKFTSPSETALTLSAEPVFAAIFSYLLVGETISPAGLVGACLLMFAIIWSTFS